jgi:pimeloyl-ACP methyl ester carboxylesterase
MLPEHETQQIERANATGLTPVVFLHGLWLVPSSWERWAALFADAGYAPLTPGWPDDPAPRAEAGADPQAPARRSADQIADRFCEVIAGLTKKPAIIGHSFGGLLAQIIAGRGLAAVSVAIAPAPSHGVLPLPVTAPKSASPVLANPANIERAVPLTYDQFRFAFANAIGEDEARELHESFAVPAAGGPLFQAASAHLDPWAAAKVRTKHAGRGPLLLVCGEQDHTAPAAIVDDAYKDQKRNPAVTKLVRIPGRGHSLTIDSGWREVAEIAVAFVDRYA